MLLIDADIELFLCGEIRDKIAALAGTDFPASVGWVSNKEWVPTAGDSTPPLWQVIVRDDGVSDVDLTVGEAQIGVNALAGSLDDVEPVKKLARIVKAIIKDCARVEPGNPVGAVLEFNGPYPIIEPSSFARQYMTAQLSVVSIPL